MEYLLWNFSCDEGRGSTAIVGGAPVDGVDNDEFKGETVGSAVFTWHRPRLCWT